MNRKQLLQKALVDRGLDALMLTSEVNRHYATRFHTSAGVVLLTRDKAHFLTDFRYTEAARALCGADYEVTEVAFGCSYRELLPELLKRYGVKKLGFESDSMTVESYERWKTLLDATFEPAQDIVQAARQLKDAQEIDAITRAQRIAERALAEVLPLLKTGITEKQLTAEITYRMMKYGAAKNSFDPIVVSGENSSKPHGEPGDRVIGDGDFVTIDIGCVVDGYCSDMTRTVAVGHATDEMKKVYDIVLQAQMAAIAACCADTPGQDIDAAARDVITDAGYGNYFGHGLGHGVGLEIHEGISAGQGVETPVPVGSILTVEPGIYLPGRFGVRIEDMVVLTADGCENLTKAPKELLIL